MNGVENFLNQLRIEDRGFASVPGGKLTLYGSCYGLLTIYYINCDIPHNNILDFILNSQDPSSGLFKGPELSEDFLKGKNHDENHILFHLTCTALSVLQQFNKPTLFPVKEAHKFCDLKFLQNWLNDRDWTKAWLEGNNLLFVGQLLVYLRDEEKIDEAQSALDLWFSWLNKEIDPNTGLWGTNGACNSFKAMCGGYHQLLVYYYENKKVQSPERLVDTVLALQHPDGGFSPSGGGGACEDVDAVDILVNLYKLNNYKRPQIRIVLRKCLKFILSLQNADGGFPYKKGEEQSHMGIPATKAPANVSTMFPTWFRVHTIALIQEILTDDPILQKYDFQFNRALSMGWHRKWNKSKHALTSYNKFAELSYSFIGEYRRYTKNLTHKGKNLIKQRFL